MKILDILRAIFFTLLFVAIVYIEFAYNPNEKELYYGEHRNIPPDKNCLYRDAMIFNIINENGVKTDKTYSVSYVQRNDITDTTLVEYNVKYQPNTTCAYYIIIPIGEKDNFCYYAIGGGKCMEGTYNIDKLGNYIIEGGR